MADRVGVTRIPLVVNLFAGVAIAIPLLLDLGHAGHLAGTTSGKILAVALIVLTALAALTIACRLVTERHHNDPAWIALLAYFCPRQGLTAGGGHSGQDA